MFSVLLSRLISFFFQAEDGIRVLVRSRGLGDGYKGQHFAPRTLSESLFIFFRCFTYAVFFTYVLVFSISRILIGTLNAPNGPP